MDGLNLVQPSGGWYRNPEFKAADHNALDRIEDKTRDDYVPPPAQLPGTGLAGGLWTANGEGRDHLFNKAMGFLGDLEHNVEDSAMGLLDRGGERRPSLFRAFSPNPARHL